jgi:hypothetical protein
MQMNMGIELLSNSVIGQLTDGRSRAETRTFFNRFGEISNYMRDHIGKDAVSPAIWEQPRLGR